MTQEANEFLQRALALSDEERAELASTLIDSLDAILDPNSEAAWQEEIARRAEELKSRNVESLSRQTVRERGRAILNGKKSH
jgi:putative addiction module component (TIGR02574 family)